MIYRHGDILIKLIDKLPEEAVKQKSNVLVYGEASGHAHALEGGDVFKMGEAIFLIIANKGKITHQEHKTIKLDKGNYAVLRTREFDYSSKKAREVRD